MPSGAVKSTKKSSLRRGLLLANTYSYLNCTPLSLLWGYSVFLSSFKRRHESCQYWLIEPTSFALGKEHGSSTLRDGRPLCLTIVVKGALSPPIVCKGCNHVSLTLIPNYATVSNYWHFGKRLYFHSPAIEFKKSALFPVVRWISKQVINPKLAIKCLVECLSKTERNQRCWPNALLLYLLLLFSFTTLPD